MSELKMALAFKKSNANPVSREKEVDEIAPEYRKVGNGSVVSPQVTEQREVTCIRSLREIPRLLPSEWLIDEVSPTLFMKRILSGQALVNAFVGDEYELERAPENAPKRIVVKEQATPEYEKHHALVLLDVSTSMTSKDGRGLLAKALAIAFLYASFVGGSQLSLSRFAGMTEEPKTGVARQGLRELVSIVVDTPMEGDSTNIQAALVKAVKHIQGQGPYSQADIVLITDGLSQLDECPLGDVRLHTLRVGHPSLREGFAMFAFNESLNKLSAWSTTERDYGESSQDMKIFMAAQDELRDLIEEYRSIHESLERLNDRRDSKEIHDRYEALKADVDTYVADQRILEGRHDPQLVEKLRKDIAADLRLMQNKFELDELIEKNQFQLEQEHMQRQQQKSIKHHLELQHSRDVLESIMGTISQGTAQLVSCSEQKDTEVVKDEPVASPSGAGAGIPTRLRSATLQAPDQFPQEVASQVNAQSNKMSQPLESSEPTIGFFAWLVKKLESYF